VKHLGRASVDLALASHARLGEKTSAHHCSLVYKRPTDSPRFNIIIHRFTSTYHTYLKW